MTGSKWSKGGIGPRVELGQGLTWAKSQDAPRFKMGCCPPPSPPARKTRTNSEHQERNKWEGQNGPRVKMGCCCLPPERVELTVNSKKETNGLVKMGQGSKLVKSQAGRCCLPTERVELKVNRNRETNGKVKMGQESRWATVFCP